MRFRTLWRKRAENPVEKEKANAYHNDKQLAVFGQRKAEKVVDHNGSRAIAVAIMYVALTGGKVIERVDFMRRRSWDEILLDLSRRAGGRLIEPNPEHRKAFYDLPYGILEALL